MQSKKVKYFKLLKISLDAYCFLEAKTGCSIALEKYGNCGQICLPTYSPARPAAYTCDCGIGYEKSPDDPSACLAIDSFILVSMTSQIRGFSMADGKNHKYEGDAVSPIGPAGKEC